MTALELARLVRETRRARRAYGDCRSASDRSGRLLEKAQAMERELDATIDAILRRPVLFETEGRREI